VLPLLPVDLPESVQQPQQQQQQQAAASITQVGCLRLVDVGLCVLSVRRFEVTLPCGVGWWLLPTGELVAYNDVFL